LRLASPSVALAAGLLVVGLCAATIVLAPLTPALSSVPDTLVWLVFPLSFTAAGVIVARREPRNAVAWLLIAVALLVALGTDAGGYAFLDYGLNYGTLPLGPVAVVLAPSFDPGFALAPLIVLLFPDGRVGRRWRWPLRGYLALVLLYVVGVFDVAAVALGRSVPVDGHGNLVGASHP
jgi:hypothetical protein